jgi:hypothetical protein
MIIFQKAKQFAFCKLIRHISIGGTCMGKLRYTNELLDNDKKEGRFWGILLGVLILIFIFQSFL